ncbi:MAG: hypothetical protein GY803_29865 [Chloroflexi bacterium]|nr:hypothetical protein [Chloroflexota bacterium]
MSQNDLLARYNYSSFTPQNVFPWMQFDQSPPIGKKAPDFPLQRLEDSDITMLSDIWSQHLYTIVEFGSFT